MLHSFPSLIAHSYRPGASTTVPLGEGVGGLKRCSTLGDKRCCDRGNKGETDETTRKEGTGTDRAKAWFIR